MFSKNIMSYLIRIIVKLILITTHRAIKIRFFKVSKISENKVFKKVKNKDRS